MHRQIMDPPKGKVVDHKNRNRLDNTRINLRVCTHAENTQNARKIQGTYSR
ncbi:HNH endonuclease [Anaerobaca lacustris]|uniref:HNH endonuclease n=1 Tax=Anaerobaca lacustris TaxID=3044600 RepID=A0AAW6U0U5_9BACT|nr:HNH endonuclease [Sedimentisphaerales bacterium M17dextr]